MASLRKYPEELRERAVRMAVDARRDPVTRPGALQRVGEQLGINPETLRGWVNQAEVDAGQRAGMTTSDARRLAELERALWNMNEKSGATVLGDSSSNKINGTIGSHIILNGSYQSFPFVKGEVGGVVDPAHIDLVNSALLNPGTRDFAVGSDSPMRGRPRDWEPVSFQLPGRDVEVASP